uniref:Putative ovule protein n=1 Tax=Solanum chacoense TaxID=4108 RepID=A0A0V0GTH0_SOLCH
MATLKRMSFNGSYYVFNIYFHKSRVLAVFFQMTSTINELHTARFCESSSCKEYDNHIHGTVSHHQALGYSPVHNLRRCS